MAKPWNAHKFLDHGNISTPALESWIRAMNSKVFKTIEGFVRK